MILINLYNYQIKKKNKQKPIRLLSSNIKLINKLIIMIKILPILLRIKIINRIKKIK
jgi:hypothetical protein